MRSICVAVLGTDGAGKTTVIKGIRDACGGGCSEVYCEHLRPNWLPPLAVLFGRRGHPAGSGGVNSDPHCQKPSGTVGSLIRLCYYLLDYIFGYWFKIRPLMWTSGRLVLFDRYFYDFLIDPQRMRIRLPRRLLEVVLSVAPRPDMLICLGADPEVLFRRKPETSLEEVGRQVRELKDLAGRERGAVWIDTGGRVAESVEAACEAIRKAACS